MEIRKCILHAHVDRDAPEAPQRLLLLDSDGEGFQTENDFSEVSHPQAVGSWAMVLPLVLDGFLHAPVCICLQHRCVA